MATPDWNIQQGTQVICITGMHRSGTSMLTRIVSLMGVELGSRLVPPLPNNNETGFWEHADIVELNEKLLESFATWHLGLADVPGEYLDLPVTQHYQERVWGILRRDFSHVPCFGVKDPRISRLMPFWQDSFRQLGAEPVWVIAIRHPGEVAASLVARNRISRERAMLLWLKYNLEVEFHTRGKKRVFLHYPDVLADWKGACRRITRFTDFSFPRAYEEAEPDMQQFLRPDLRHQQESTMANVPAWMARAYHVLKEAANSASGEVDTTSLDAIRADFESMQAPLQEELRKLRDINLAQAKDIEDLERHLDILFHSLSWQITRPVRAVKKSVKQWMNGAEERRA